MPFNEIWEEVEEGRRAFGPGESWQTESVLDSGQQRIVIARRRTPDLHRMLGDGDERDATTSYPISTASSNWGASIFSAFFSRAAASAGFAGAAIAHPHVWATVRSEIVFGPDHRITGIRHHWTFDEFYTAMAVQGLDANGDGVYSKEELQPLAQVNVESLKDFDYFTFVHLSDDDKPLPLKEPVDYSVDYDKTLLTLHFTLPLEKPLDPKVHEVAVDVYDPSFFVAFGFATDAPVKIAGHADTGLHRGDPKARP